MALVDIGAYEFQKVEMVILNSIHASMCHSPFVIREVTPIELKGLIEFNLSKNRTFCFKGRIDFKMS